MKYNIVTIERQYGSGGRQVGELLAQRWDVPLYDRAILEETAANLSADPERVAKLEESNTNSLLYSLIMAGQMLDPTNIPLSPGEKVFQESSRVIRAAAGRGPCVIVGRAAGFVLRNQPKVLRVFLYADRESRLERCMKVYGLTEAEAKDMMRRQDRNRAEFYRSVADHDWDDRSAYALFLNTAELGIEACVDAIDAICRG